MLRLYGRLITIKKHQNEENLAIIGISDVNPNGCLFKKKIYTKKFS
jgi:hypothetical protein